MTTLEKDLQNIVDSFKGQINDQKHRENLETELNKVLFTALGTDVFSFKCTGCRNDVFVDIYYKGQRVSRSGYLAEIAREMEHENDPFLAKGKHLDNLAELHGKYRNHGETDGQFRKRILEELKEESELGI